MTRIATWRDLQEPGCHPSKPARYQDCLDNPGWRPKTSRIFIDAKIDLGARRDPGFFGAFAMTFGRGIGMVAQMGIFAVMNRLFFGNNNNAGLYTGGSGSMYVNNNLLGGGLNGSSIFGNSVLGGGYAGGDVFAGSNFDLAHTWANPIHGQATPTPNNNAAQGNQNGNGNVQGNQNGNGNVQGNQNGNGNVQGNQNGNGSVQGNQNGNGNVQGNQNGNGNAAGNALYNAVIDKNADGTNQIYSGVFASKDHPLVENGATLKKGDATRGALKNGAAQTTDNDFKDAVRLGKAQGGTDADKEKDPTTGAPKYFTMTDYRSGNEYTFKLMTSSDGSVKYQIDKAASNLAHDNQGINGHNWEFKQGVENLVFDVNVDASSHEIKLSYNGNGVSFDQLAQQS